MAEPVVATTPAAPAAPQPTADELSRAQEKSAGERSAALLAKAVKEAEKSLAEPEATEPEAAPAEKPRAPDGKFAKKPEKTEESAPAEPAEAEATESEQTAGTIAQARKLMAEGKFEEAARLAFGKPLDELPIKASHWHAWRQQQKKARAAIESERAEISRQAEQIVKTYEPLAKARQAIETGDFDALAKAYGFQDFNALSRQAFGAKMQTASSPQLSRIEQELAALRAEKQQREQLEAQQRQQAIASHRQSLTNALQTSGDARLSKAASKPGFIARVHEIQRENWDGATTLSPLDAAEIAWDEICGGVLDDSADSDRSAHSEATTARARTPVKQPARKAGRQISTQVTSEAAPARTKLRGEALLQHYARQAEALIARDDGGIG